MLNILNKTKNSFENYVSEASHSSILSDNSLKQKADKAIDSLIYNRDLRVIQEWRGKHLSPMIKLKDFVVEKMQESQIDCDFVSARLKMITTIIDKIKTGRHKKLSTMQDLGGVRVVFHNQEDLYKLHALLLECNVFKIVRTKDYIKEPKETGYRGIHIIYNVDGYNIELQLRTEGQHIWASTVETVGWYLKQDFKSGLGGEKILEYFKKISVVFSNQKESCEDIKMPYLIKEALDDMQSKVYIFGSGINHKEHSMHNPHKRESDGVTKDVLNADVEIRNFYGNYLMLNIHLIIRNNIRNNIFSDCLFIDSYQDPIKGGEYYKTREDCFENRTTLFIWINDTSKLEDAYPCFFSQTKQFTDYLHGLKD